MSTLFDPLLKFSSLRTDYLESPPNRSIFERWSISEMLINVVIPLCILIAVIFILKERYDTKQQRIKLAETFQKQVRNNQKKISRQQKYRNWN